MSNNYYEKGWGLKTHRRLKNVIVIMEFCPSVSSLHIFPIQLDIYLVFLSLCMHPYINLNN